MVFSTVLLILFAILAVLHSNSTDFSLHFGEAKLLPTLHIKKKYFSSIIEKLPNLFHKFFHSLSVYHLHYKRSVLLDDLHYSSYNYSRFSIKFYLLENLSASHLKEKGKGKDNEEHLIKIIEKIELRIAGSSSCRLILILYILSDSQVVYRQL